MSATTEWVEGGAPGISAARLNEPFHVRAASFDSVNNRINVTIGPGRAAFLGVIAERLADTIHHIAAPTVNTTYHIYVHSNNTFSHNTTGAEPAGAVRLGTVRTGAALADPMTRTDVRGQLPGAAARAHADEATAHGSTGAIVGVDSSITIDPVPAPTGNVGGLRALLGWLANRIRAITGTTNWWDAPATTLATAHTHHGRVDNPHNITVAQIGAVNRAGDTMTGTLIAPDVLWGAGNRRVVALASGTDLNNVITSGWYHGDVLVNGPVGSGDWGHVMVSRGANDNWVMQLYMSLYDERGFFIRRSFDVTGARIWGPWQRLWHSGNDGIGSGLDADLVRGEVPFAVSHRQGGHATSWNVGGTTNHAPAGARVQVGATAAVTLAPGQHLVTVTFPVEFASTPLVIATVWHSSGTYNGIVRVESVSATQVGLLLSNISAVGSGTFGANWVALGPV